MTNLEWDRSIFQIGDATVEIIREKLYEDYDDEYNDFFDRFD